MAGIPRGCRRKEDLSRPPDPQSRELYCGVELDARAGNQVDSAALWESRQTPADEIRHLAKVRAAV
jgi:hypothetical protein